MKTRNAFTLVEVIIVIAVLMILAAILFPVFTRAKQAAKRSVCVSQLHQLHLATSLYRTDHDGDGVYGTATSMGLPTPPYDYSVLFGQYGYMPELSTSPCGVHPEAIGGIFDVWGMSSWWPTLTPIYQEGTPLWFDWNCNDHDVKLFNWATPRRSIAVLLSGTVVIRVGTGNMAHPSFYSSPL